MRSKKRIIVPPQNAVEDLTLDDVKAAFGVSTDPPPAQDPPRDPPQDPPAGEPQDPPAGTTQDPPQDPPAGEPQDPPAGTTQDPPPKEPPKTGADPKVAQAFAAMRVQNKNYEKIMNGIADVLGVKDTSNPEAVMGSLNDLILKAEAKKQNVPEELYKRLHTLEERDQLATQEEIRRTAYLGFQAVKDKHKLTDEQLNHFADELHGIGLNPFETQLDLVKEYRNLHFEDIVKQAVEEGARAEVERSTKAATHSSAPNPKKGQAGSDPEKINSVAQLNAWFDNQKK